MGSWLPWRKLASNPPGLDWPALPWQSRGLYALLLGLCDDCGVIRLGKLGLPSLAGALRASWSEIDSHFDALVMAGWAESQEGQVKLPHFEDSQRAATTAERVAQYRAHARNEPVTTPKRSSNEPLPRSNEPVTKSYPDKNRSEEIRSDTSVPSGPSQPASPPTPQQAAESEPDKPQGPEAPKRVAKAQVIAQTALALFGELQAARKRCNPGTRKVTEVLPGHTREIERCLRDGLTAEQVRHVIAVWEELVKAGKREGEHFGSVSPFRAGNVMAYVEMSISDAKKPRTAPQGLFKPQEPAKAPSGNPAGGLDFATMRAKAAEQVDPRVQAELDKLLGRV